MSRHVLRRASALMVLLTAACGHAGTPPAPTNGPIAVTQGAATLPAIVPALTKPADGTTAPAAPPPEVTTFPNAPAFSWKAVAAGFALPDDVQFPDDGSGRMFVLEQPGRIRLVKDGRLLDKPFLDITDRVGSFGNEQGLLGLAFHPDFKDHPYFYVNYTDVNGNTVIARFQADGDSADASSEKAVLRVKQPFPNHNGGEMTFGPDGFLWLGLGDGGSQGDPLGNGQNTQVLLGKILRIDVDGGDPYRIPEDNPFASRGTGLPEIWAYGLRNPWRFSFDRGTGDLYIADVGQDTWEEVDYLPAGSPGGENFGWNYFEGNHPYAGVPPASLQLTGPVAEYSHQVGGCAIVGGYVYRGAMPEWQGVCLYGDNCSGKIWGLLRKQAGGQPTNWQSTLLFETGASITSFGQDPKGEIYFADRNGVVYRLQK